MPTPFVSGSSAIPNRWLNGSATVLWIGDSIGVAFENRLFHALRVTPAGLGVRGASYGSLSPAWAAAAAGALGAAGLLTENAYSPFPSAEAVFNGSVVPVTGAPATLDARLQSASAEPLLLGTRTGITFIPASNGGWSVLTWLDTTKISDAALAGVLPLLGITDIVISIGNNNPAAQTAALFQASLQQLANRFRVALPNASIVFLPTYDTNNAGSAPHLAGFADAHYAAQQATDNSCFLNLYKAAGLWTHNNALGFYADGVHPTESGKMFFLQTLQTLLDQLIIGARTTAAGRYANQSDVEDLFGQSNIAAWSQFDGSDI